MKRIAWFTRCPDPSSTTFEPSPFCILLVFRHGTIILGRHKVVRQVSDRVIAEKLIRESARI